MDEEQYKLLLCAEPHIPQYDLFAHRCVYIKTELYLPQKQAVQGSGGRKAAKNSTGTIITQLNTIS